MEDLKYPIGKFDFTSEVTEHMRESWIDQITEAPSLLREAVSGLTDEQLDTPYRSGGWTIRQVVHHVPDSHMNAYIRFKLALTEEEPTIKPYYEDRWATLSDSLCTHVEISLTMLESLHARWTVLLRSLSNEELSRTLYHPENGVMTLDKCLGLYAWHGKHHIAHITTLRKRLGW